jgi:NTP pyrophosphatase (non-canonical NTP hydrolase)
MVDLPNIAEECARIATAHGFHDKPRTIGEAAMLITTEVSEFYEAWRCGRPTKVSEEKLRTAHMLEELADIIIRVCDTAVCDLGVTGELLTLAVLDKMQVNRNRPMMHGGKEQ